MQIPVFDKAKTAILIMDYQNEIIAALPEEQQKLLLQSAKDVLEAGRQAKMLVIYVVVCFRPGYPELSARNKAFSALKERGMLKEGTKEAEIHPDISPQPNEIIITNRRAGSFSTTDLDAVLRAKEIDTLVLLGIATGGVVLSTVRWAADMDYNLLVVSNGCADHDDEVNRVLIEKVFPRQATVVTTQEFLSALKT